MWHIGACDSLSLCVCGYVGVSCVSTNVKLHLVGLENWYDIVVCWKVDWESDLGQGGMIRVGGR